MRKAGTRLASSDGKCAQCEVAIGIARGRPPKTCGQCKAKHCGDHVQTICNQCVKGYAYMQEEASQAQSVIRKLQGELISLRMELSHAREDEANHTACAPSKKSPSHSEASGQASRGLAQMEVEAAVPAPPGWESERRSLRAELAALRSQVAEGGAGVGSAAALIEREELREEVVRLTQLVQGLRGAAASAPSASPPEPQPQPQPHNEPAALRAQLAAEVERRQSEEQAAAEARGTAEHLQAQLDCLRGHKEELEAEVGRVTGQLVPRLTAQLEAAAHDLVQKDVDVAEAKAKAEACTSEAAAQGAELERSQALVLHLNAQLADLAAANEDALHASARQITQKDAELAESQTSITRMAAEVAESEGKLSSVAAVLKESQSEFSRVEAKLTQSESEMAQKESELAAVRKEVARKARELADSKASIEQKDSELVHYKAVAEQTESELADWRSGRKDDGAAAVEGAEAEALRAEAEALRAEAFKWRTSALLGRQKAALALRHNQILASQVAELQAVQAGSPDGAIPRGSHAEAPVLRAFDALPQAADDAPPQAADDATDAGAAEAAAEAASEDDFWDDDDWGEGWEQQGGDAGAPGQGLDGAASPGPQASGKGAADMCTLAVLEDAASSACQERADMAARLAEAQAEVERLRAAAAEAEASQAATAKPLQAELARLRLQVEELIEAEADARREAEAQIDEQERIVSNVKADMAQLSALKVENDALVKQRDGAEQKTQALQMEVAVLFELLHRERGDK